MSNITCVGNLRSTLGYLGVFQTGAKSISEILQCDVVHKTNLKDDQVLKKRNVVFF